VNDDPDHDSIEDLWATAEYVAFNEERISLGSPACWRESGTITIVISGISGDGDAALLVASNNIRNAYRGWDVDKISVIKVDPPQATPSFSDGNWYSMEINLTYDYDYFI
jgi:hypothetical protein